MDADTRRKVRLLDRFLENLGRWEDPAVKGAHRDAIRSRLNKDLERVREVVREVGCSRTLTLSPPPAVGGLVLNGVDPFDAFLDPPYGLNVARVVRDILDRTLGVLHAGNLQTSAATPPTPDPTTASHASAPRLPGDVLPAEPPPLLKHIRWLMMHGRRHPGYILIAIIIVVAVWVATTWLPQRATRQEAGHSNGPGENLGPLRATFADGAMADVSLWAATAVIPESVIAIHRRYGSPEPAREHVIALIRGATLDYLERYPAAFVRTHRAAIADTISLALGPGLEHIGFRLADLQLHDIDIDAP